MWLYVVILLILYFLFHQYCKRLMVPNLHDKHVLITGCDSGFGNLVARQLDLRGLRVLAACLTEKGAKQLENATSDRLKTIILDVTKSESVAAMAEWVKQEVGDKGLWGLVNNAGISIPSAPNEWLTKQDFQRILDVNLLGVIDVTLNLAPMVRKARGRIVNVSSVMGRMSLFGGGYCISKYGVEAFSDSLRRELNPFGVKVSMIEPGFFKTPVTDAQIVLENYHRIWEQTSAEVRESYGQQYFNHVLKISSIILPRSSTNLSLVTDCMEHGLTAVHPKTRYSAGYDAKLLYLPLSYLPTSVVDQMLDLIYRA